MPIELAQACVDRATLETGLDDAIFTLHFDLSAHDTASRTAATNKIKTFWTNVAASIGTQHILREVKWYEVQTTAPRSTFKESILTGTAPGTPGTSGGAVLPPQVACSVTLKTVPRRHWGRFYLPGFTATQLDDSGHRGAWKATTCDTVAAAAATLCSTTGGNAPIIWNRLAGTNYGITEVQVDNVADVVRRRRMRRATYKKRVTP